MVGREGRIGGGEKKKGKREVGRGPIEGSTMKKKASWQAALWKSVDLNSTANNHLICHSALALFFFPPPYTLPSLAWRLISMLLKVTTGHVRAFLWFIFSSYNAIMLWILLGKLLISSGRSGKQILAWHSSCLFIIQSGGNIFLETVFKWLCLLISSTVQTSIRHNPNTCFHLSYPLDRSVPAHNPTHPS